ncbi:Na(+)/H(+) antiporter NhaA [Rosistilla ulvae]|uniref:Na(+)/H(+) antiporter NhaA n=1 Tax=Rosistilla ulvae TaxID=1930277 RepID=A0A517M0Y5_9BACT|nr:Na+/H+ antiporter NhaA [Rosistilla ulvae]QDS88544.1 Na(+)/H(+) antiporter NhaA [Rosistilla ulvae]
METNQSDSARRIDLRFFFENSLFLVLGAAIALIWANVANSQGSDAYNAFVHWDIAQFLGLSHGHAHAAEAGGHHGFTIHFLVNDILMALFFAIAAKEVWEALLPGGPLSNLRKAATPLLATLGGVAGPAIVYLAGTTLLGRNDTLGAGWAVPCATDIAFSLLVARMIFGGGHAAISFLLLLAIADDAIGLMILAVFYPSAETNFAWLGFTVAAVASGMAMNRAGVRNFWWYLAIPGVLSWVSFYMAGIHAALGLVPIIPTLPHAKTDLGFFAKAEDARTDTLNAFEHWWKHPVELILGMFALVNAGVVFSSVGAGTGLVLLGLFVGKPLGISLMTLLAVRSFKLEMPEGMNMRHVVVLGCIASLGFTVALFVSTAAFPMPGPIQDSVKMGALMSFLAPVSAFAMAMALGIRPACFGKRKPAAATQARKPPKAHKQHAL